MNGSDKLVVIKDAELWAAIQKEAKGLETIREALRRKYNLPPPTNKRGPKPHSKRK